MTLYYLSKGRSVYYVSGMGGTSVIFKRYTPIKNEKMIGMPSWKKVQTYEKNSCWDFALRKTEFHLCGEKCSKISACGVQHIKIHYFCVFSGFYWKKCRPLGRRFFFRVFLIGMPKTLKITLSVSPPRKSRAYFMLIWFALILIKSKWLGYKRVAAGIQIENG